MPGVRVYDDPSAFQLLEEEWKALFRQQGGWNVFLSWQWFSQWWSCFGADKEPCILAMWDHDRLVGLAPMMVETDEVGRRRLALIGSDRTTDYADLLVDPRFLDPMCRLLAEFVVEGFGRWGYARFESLDASSPLLGPFLEAARRKGASTGVRPTSTCPRIALATDWDGYLAGLDKTHRHELRRKIRRSQAVGRQEVLFLAGRDEIAASMDSFLRLHRASSAAKAAFQDDSVRCFFRGIAGVFAEEGWARLSLMRIDGRDVAASLSFTPGDRVLLYNSGSDPEYRAHSVGIALHAAEIRHAIEQGNAWYDFLRGNEPYKYDLGGRDNPVFRLTLLPGDSDHAQFEDGRG